MKKRFALLWTLVVLSMALMLPATTAAASYGKITNTSTSCKNGGNKVVANFKLTKYSGFYATRLEISAWGQGKYSSGWKNEYFLGTYYANIPSSQQYGGYYMTQGFYYVDNAAGSSRIKAVAKIKNGGYLVAKGNAVSGYCG
jgi:hypothetical protein